MFGVQYPSEREGWGWGVSVREQRTGGIKDKNHGQIAKEARWFYGVMMLRYLWLLARI